MARLVGGITFRQISPRSAGAEYQRMPLRTLRRPFHGRPRPSLRRGGSGIRASRPAHWRSVKSRELRRGIRPAPDKLLLEPCSRCVDVSQKPYDSDNYRIVKKHSVRTLQSQGCRRATYCRTSDGRRISLAGVHTISQHAGLAWSEEHSSL